MPDRQPSDRRIFWPAVIAVVLALVVGAGGFLAAWAATFTDQAPVTANTFTTDTLDPPTGLTASVVDSDIRLDWTPIADSYATGYEVLRDTTSGGPYTPIATVTPYTATTYTDDTVSPDIHYYYVLQTYFQSWLSVYSNEVTSIVPLSAGWCSPTAEAAVTINSGDNNGFELNPTDAFADGGSYAEDGNSGTANSQDCASTARDRHLFYDYGFAIPGGSTINGIEVRLDAWADSTTGSPKVCVELSWDGGTTWTAARTTTDLATGEQTYILGSAGDTWGRTWSSAEFSDANFRLRINNVADSIWREFRLDWLPVRVAYTSP